MPAGQLELLHARSFALFGAADRAAAFHRAIRNRMQLLGLHASDFEPFAAERGDEQLAQGDLALRILLDWASAVVMPSDSQAADDRAADAANVLMLGRLAATLDRRFAGGLVAPQRQEK